ncbi:sulfotransferase [Rugosimonospora africana]|uniref:sulfotransferase n=1 Tax=Rugosimonospora africana TaxID=556532 RepID=UPI001941EFFD|nr:sulfotransferase [Rugosimonospora africana]
MIESTNVSRYRQPLQKTAGRTPDPVRVLFIGGMGRSGSTLVERTLGELPGMYALGEVALLAQRVSRDDVRCGCGAPFTRCEFWAAVGERAFGGWHNIDVERLRRLHAAVGRNRRLLRLLSPRPGADRLAMASEYAEHYSRIYAAVGRVTGARVIVDSSKNPGLALCLRRAPGIDLRVLHLLRDPRGVAHSSTKRVAEPETDRTTFLPRQSPALTAVQWSAQNAAFDLFAGLRWAGSKRRRQPNPGHMPVRRLRYESFLADPRRAVRTVAEFAGLPIGDADLSFLDDDSVKLGVTHSAAGNPMRFSTGRIELRLDAAWQTALAPRSRRLVTLLCAAQLLAYGYPLTSRVQAAADEAAAVPAADEAEG